VRGAVLPWPLAAGLVFVSSGAVLVLEILGLRLLAPYVGLTLETTTTIIGTVLAGIAAGAAVGGRLADWTDARRILPAMLAAGGALAIATVPIVRLLGTGLQDQGGAAALVITLTALFPPALVLSAVTPTVAKIQLRDLGSTGSVVGRLSAWATTGGLVGTFATGFLIVPVLPTDVAVLVVGAALLALALVVALLAGGRPSANTGLLAASAVVLAAGTFIAGSPCTAETTYHCAQVVPDPERASGRTLVLDDVRHSYVDLDDPRLLDFNYTQWIGDAIDGMAPARRPLDAVFIGGGGFTLPRYLETTRPGSSSQVLEVDAPLVGLARERFRLRTGPGLRVRTGDARVTLRRERTDSADLVVGDAFGGRSVPWHLATVEFAEEIRRVLRPDGLYAVNVIDNPPLKLLKAQAATLLATFRDVALVARRTPDGTPVGGNAVLLASDAPLPRAVASSARSARTDRRAALARFAAGADPLRDDDAPADQLLTVSR
jgi:spermidine synthase